MMPAAITKEEGAVMNGAGSATAAPPVSTLRSHSELQSHLASLTQRETELTLALNELISNRSNLDDALDRLRRLVPRIREIEAEVDGGGDRKNGSVGATTPSGGKGNPNNVGGASPRTRFAAGLAMSSTSLARMNELNYPSNARYDEDDDMAYQNDIDVDEDSGLVERIARVYVTSERVGGKVRTLDREVSRVQESLDRVNAVLEVKTHFATLLSALGGTLDQRLEASETNTNFQPSYDLAALSYSHISRLHASDPTLLTSPFATRTIPTPENPAQPIEALRNARDRLLDSFREEFGKAARGKDEEGTGRFFRMFPEIDAEEEGLQIYGDFVVNLVKSRSAAGGKPSSPLYYITHLTSLLESIALLINQHQSIVEKYYGPRRMITVLQRLQNEADRVVKSLVEGWEEERRVGRLIADTELSKFTYLNNPINPQNAAIGIGLVALSQQAQHNLAALPSAATSLLANYAGTAASRQRQQQQQAEEQQHQQQIQLAQQQQQQEVGAQVEEEDKGPDVRDVDRVLGEMSALGGRWALYRRFVWGRLSVSPDDEDVLGAASENGRDVSSLPQAEIDPAQRVLDESESQRTVDNMLRTYYEPLEVWYLRMSMEKAHKMDTPDLSSAPYLSSVVDDVFYLLKLSLNRIVSAGSVRSLTAMRESLSYVIERDYLGILQKKMDAVYSGGGAVLNIPSLPGQNKEAERERRERDMRTTFSVLLNDLEVSASYMERLVEDILANSSTTQCFSDVDLPEVEKQVKLFTNLSTRMRGVVKSGLDQLFNQLTRPKLRALLEDCYKGVSYVLDEDGYADAEATDLVRKRFAKGWEPLVEGYKQAFTEGNYQLFFSMTVEVLVRPWEKMVFGMRFTELGAIRFDRDVRAIANYLSTQSEFGGARDKFIRLQQIATLLNLDADDDPEDFYASSGIPWKLSKTEYDNVPGLRV